MYATCGVAGSRPPTGGSADHDEDDGVAIAVTATTRMLARALGPKMRIHVDAQMEVNKLTPEHPSPESRKDQTREIRWEWSHTPKPRCISDNSIINAQSAVRELHYITYSITCSTNGHVGFIQGGFNLVVFALDYDVTNKADMKRYKHKQTQTIVIQFYKVFHYGKSSTTGSTTAATAGRCRSAGNIRSPRARATVMMRMSLSVTCQPGPAFFKRVLRYTASLFIKDRL